MNCLRCGAANAEGAAYCSQCGNPLTPPPPGASGELRTSRLAITSLVLGILSIFCWLVMALPSIIFGILALVNIKENRGQLKGKGLAITGISISGAMILVMPFVFMALAILMPALSKTKMIAQRVVCGTNLKGLTTAMMVYVQDYDGILPNENWCDLLIEQADVSPQSFICPSSDAVDGESSYAMNENIAGMDLDDLPGDIVLFFETDKGLEAGPRITSIQDRRHYEFLNEFGNVYDEDAMVYSGRFNQYGGPEDLLIRHTDTGSSGCNVAFTDGHVEFVRGEAIERLRWTVEE